MSRQRKGEMEKERWIVAVEAAQEGRFEEIPRDIYLRLLNNCHKLAVMHQKPIPNLLECCGRWVFGDSGTGKTYAVERVAPVHYKKMCNKWWDGYQGEEDVVIEDFDIVHEALGHHLKIWADIMPFIAEVKGGSMLIRPKRIFVTSNYSIEEIWGVGKEKTRIPIEERFVTSEFRGPSLRNKKLRTKEIPDNIIKDGVLIVEVPPGVTVIVKEKEREPVITEEEVKSGTEEYFKDENYKLD